MRRMKARNRTEKECPSPGGRGTVFLFIAVLSIFLFFGSKVVTTQSAEKESLVTNGGLEGEYQELEDDFGFIAPDWVVRDGEYNFGTWSAEPEFPHAGTFSQKIEIEARVPRGIQQNRPNIPLEKDKEYIFSLWHKGTGGDVLLYGFQANPRKDILLVDSTKPEGKFEMIPDWKKYEIKFQPSDDCDSFILRINGTGPGIIYLDDVVLMEVNER